MRRLAGSGTLILLVSISISNTFFARTNRAVVVASFDDEVFVRQIDANKIFFFIKKIKILIQNANIDFFLIIFHFPYYLFHIIFHQNFHLLKKFQ
jgi:hypothetical protein